MRRIVVLGGGFAGLWAAAGAARKRAELGLGPGEVDILLVDRNPWHNIRVRNYEPDLTDVAIPLADVLDPIAVRYQVAEIRGVDPVARRVVVADRAGMDGLAYDALVLATGSALVRPAVEGLEGHGFDVDTYAGAQRLAGHLAGLAATPPGPGRACAVVVGGGFTGIEVAARMPERLAPLAAGDGVRVVLVDHAPRIGATLGEGPAVEIPQALAALGIETRTGVRVVSLRPEGAVLDSGERLAARTIVWCGGMAASPLARGLGQPVDGLGRVGVRPDLSVAGLPGVFAAGDAAWSRIDGVNPTVMSCQYARPMGRFAGHNAMAALAGQPTLPLVIDWYVTVLDLGSWGGLYMAGRERRVIAEGAPALRVKEEINRRRIYPPRTGDAAAILAAAAPVVQAAPAGVGVTAPG